MQQAHTVSLVKFQGQHIYKMKQKSGLKTKSKRFREDLQCQLGRSFCLQTQSKFPTDMIEVGSSSLIWKV